MSSFLLFLRQEVETLFSCMLLRRTKSNLSVTPRLAYVVEYMSTKTYDPHLSLPYFMVAKNGVSVPAFEQSYPGRKNPLNRLKYAWK